MCVPGLTRAEELALLGLWLRRRSTALVEVAAVGVPAVAALWAVPTYPWSLALALIACALLPLRHLRPELAVLAVLPAVATGLGWPAAVVALYALGRRSRTVARVWPWLAVVVLVVVVPVQIREALPWQRLALTVCFAALYAGAPAALGMLVSTRARLTDSLHALQHARADAAAAAEEAARAQERARIGREIHDAVGHHATLIAVGAAALAASTDDPRTRESAEQIRLLAKRALAEMRAALGLLDTPGAEPAGDRTAGLPELDSLLAGARAAGVDVAVTHDGPPVELPSATGRAVYRVVQESLTNAARHATGQPVEVALTWAEEHLSVRVRNTIADVAPRLEVAGEGGRGLTGLAERVASLGGDLEAGPTDTATFAVTATFPLVVAASQRADVPQPA